MSETVYSQTACSIPEDLNIKCHTQEYGLQRMSRRFTVDMFFVFDFLNAETILIQRQTHEHHKQANVRCKCTVLSAG
jgi:hypothetical protein